MALGSGAARGFASIGVLKVLEKNGIKPSIVAGTSMFVVVVVFFGCFFFVFVFVLGLVFFLYFE